MILKNWITTPNSIIKTSTTFPTPPVEYSHTFGWNWESSLCPLNASPNLPNNMTVSIIGAILFNLFLAVPLNHQINFFHQPFHVRQNCMKNWSCLTIQWLKWFVWFFLFFTWNMYFKYRNCWWSVPKGFAIKIFNSWCFSYKLIVKQNTR